MADTMSRLHLLGTSIGCILVMNFLLSACSNPTDSKANIDLLAIPSTNSKPLSYDSFNKQLVDAATSKAEWASEPTMILHSFIGSFLGRSVLITINRLDAQGPQNIYKAIVIFDDIADGDSIRGYRYDIKLSQDEQDVWQVIEANKSWRCKKDRGHTDFSSENCV